MIEMKYPNAFRYSWTEYFNVLLDQLEQWKSVLSEKSINDEKILPHMLPHLKRLSMEDTRFDVILRIDQIIKNLTYWNNNENDDIIPNMDNKIIRQLMIFRDDVMFISFWKKDLDSVIESTL